MAGDGKLRFTQAASNNARLVFGAPGTGSAPAPPAIPPAPMGCDAAIAGEGAASCTLRCARRMQANASAPDPEAGSMDSSQAQLRWNANISRPAHWRSSTTHWQSGQQRSAASRTHWQQAKPRAVQTGARWQAARPLPAPLLALHWQTTSAQRAATRTHWQQAQPRPAAPLPAHWQESTRLRAAWPAHWQESTRLPDAPLAMHWQESTRLRHATRTHWQRAQRLRTPLHWRWQARAVPAFIALAAHWQEAMRPPAGRSAAPVLPAPPPCYDPQRLGLLVFDALFATASARLVFICRRAAAPPAPPPPYFIPALRVYVQVNDITAHLLPGMQPLPLYEINISSDDEGYGWQLQAGCSAEVAASLHTPPDAPPSALRVQINGIAWEFILTEPPHITRAFGRWQAHVHAASRSALLGAPWHASRQWSSSTTMTAQQIALLALEYTGFTLQWHMHDWQVPPAAFNHEGSALSLLRRVAHSGGAALRSHRTQPELVIAPRYPEMPWHWSSAPVQAHISAQAILSDSWQAQEAPRCDHIWVMGETAGGVKARAHIAASAQNRAAEQIIDPFITDAHAARQRARAELARSHIGARHSITLPFMAQGTQVPQAGWLIEVAEPQHNWRAQIAGVSIRASLPEAHISLALERAAQ